VLRDPTDEERRRRLFLPTKQNNTADDDTGLAFRIVADGDSETAHIQWCEGTVEISADEALEQLNSRRSKKTDDDPSAAEVFLQEILKDGPVDAAIIEREAKQAGTSYRACHRYKDKWESGFAE
jgi:hypothetical protein